MKVPSLRKIHTNPLLPGDKSISHRALILSSLSKGDSHLKGVPCSQDILSTLNVLKKLGVEFEQVQHNQAMDLVVRGKGKYFEIRNTSQEESSATIEKPLELDCGNSGTLMRLISGVLAGQKFSSILRGDSSLEKRPMKRIADPLNHLGAKISLFEDRYAPIIIEPSSLYGETFDLEISSAQVKSAILLAGLYVESSGKDVFLKGRIHSRDHTERLLKYYGAEISMASDHIRISPRTNLSPRNFKIPKDISAGAFWITAGLLAQESQLALEDVGLNPTRMGFVNVLKRSHAPLEVLERDTFPEPRGDIHVCHQLFEQSKFEGFHIHKEEISSLIDEIPLLALLATQAHSDSRICGVGELRFKETDRVMTTIQTLEALGGVIKLDGEDFIIPGNQRLRGGRVDPKGDHRIAMMGAVSAFCTKEPVEIVDMKCSRVSDPFFEEQLKDIVERS